MKEAATSASDTETGDDDFKSLISRVDKQLAKAKDMKVNQSQGSHSQKTASNSSKQVQNPEPLKAFKDSHGKQHRSPQPAKKTTMSYTGSKTEGLVSFPPSTSGNEEGSSSSYEVERFTFEVKRPKSKEVPPPPTEIKSLEEDGRKMNQVDIRSIDRTGHYHTHDFASPSFNERRKMIQQEEDAKLKEKLHLEYRGTNSSEEELLQLGNVSISDAREIGKAQEKRSVGSYEFKSSSFEDLKRKMQEIEEGTFQLGYKETEKKKDTADEGRMNVAKQKSQREDFQEEDLFQHDLRSDSLMSSELLKTLNQKYKGVTEDELKRSGPRDEFDVNSQSTRHTGQKSQIKETVSQEKLLGLIDREEQYRKRIASETLMDTFEDFDVKLKEMKEERENKETKETENDEEGEVVTKRQAHSHDFESDSFNERRHELQEKELGELDDFERIHVDYRSGGKQDDRPERNDNQEQKGITNEEERQMHSHDFESDSFNEKRRLQQEKELEGEDDFERIHLDYRKKGEDFDLDNKSRREVLSQKSSMLYDLGTRKGKEETVSNKVDTVGQETNEDFKFKKLSKKSDVAYGTVAVRTQSGRKTKYKFESKKDIFGNDREKMEVISDKEEAEEKDANFGTTLQRKSHMHDFASKAFNERRKELDNNMEFEELIHLEYREGILKKDAKMQYSGAREPISSDPTNSLYNPGMNKTRYQPAESCNRCTTNQNAEMPLHADHSGGPQSSPASTAAQQGSGVMEKSPPDPPEESEKSKEKSKSSAERRSAMRALPASQDPSLQLPPSKDLQKSSSKKKESSQKLASKSKDEMSDDDESEESERKDSSETHLPQAESEKTESPTKEEEELNNLKSIVKRIYIRTEEIALLAEARRELTKGRNNATKISGEIASHLLKVQDMAQDLDQKLCQPCSSRRKKPRRLKI